MGRNSALGFLMALCICLCDCAKVATNEAEVAEKALAERAAPLLERAGAGIEDAWIQRTLEGGPKAVFTAFEKIRPKSRWKLFTTKDVKKFVRLFEAGARNPEQYLNDPKVDQAFLARWKAAPKNNRVFIAGSQRDTELVGDLRTQLEKEGKEVFFYRFCTPVLGELCSTETVGAFFGTAGAAFVAVTSDSNESRYVPKEIAAALNSKMSGQSLLLVTPQELLDAAERDLAVRIVACSVNGDAPGRR